MGSFLVDVKTHLDVTREKILLDREMRELNGAYVSSLLAKAEMWD
jgi:hypothetical protein